MPLSFFRCVCYNGDGKFQFAGQPLVAKLKIDNGKLKIMVSPSAMISIISEGNSSIFNFQF